MQKLLWNLTVEFQVSEDAISLADVLLDQQSG